jgi:hypothetical protein
MAIRELRKKKCLKRPKLENRFKPHEHNISLLKRDPGIGEFTLKLPSLEGGVGGG